MFVHLFPEFPREAGPQSCVILAGSDFPSRDVLMDLLQQQGLAPISSSTLNDTESLAAQDSTALVLCHAKFNRGELGTLLKGSRVPVIVCADDYDPRLYLEAMESGAFDYLTRPYYRDGVEWVVRNALKARARKQRNEGTAKRAMQKTAAS